MMIRQGIEWGAPSINNMTISSVSLEKGNVIPFGTTIADGIYTIYLKSSDNSNFNIVDFLNQNRKIHPMYLSEDSFAEFWNTPEEDEAWSYL